MIDAKKKKKRRSTCRIRRNNTAVSTGVLKARHLWTNLALYAAGTHSFEKQYKNRLMQNQAMELITAGRAMRHRAILGDFASPDSQIAMETSIIGCRIARFCFSVTGLLRRRTLDQTVLGSNPAVAAALSPWTRLFTPIVPRRREAFTLASISYLAILVKYINIYWQLQYCTFFTCTRRRKPSVEYCTCRSDSSP